MWYKHNGIHEQTSKKKFNLLAQYDSEKLDCQNIENQIIIRLHNLIPHKRTKLSIRY